MQDNWSEELTAIRISTLACLHKVAAEGTAHPRKTSDWSIAHRVGNRSTAVHLAPQAELSPLVLPLAPLASRAAPHNIPFQTLAEGTGSRTLITQVTRPVYSAIALPHPPLRCISTELVAGTMSPHRDSKYRSSSMQHMPFKS